MIHSLCFRNDVDDLFKELAHDPRAWRLFINSSSRCMNCVLLYNGNQYSPILLGHSFQMTDYKKVKFLLECIIYTKYN